ncbi:hypothetical protein BaRGS_00007325, partial [Batillaria attramentaria]
MEGPRTIFMTRSTSRPIITIAKVWNKKAVSHADTNRWKTVKLLQRQLYCNSLSDAFSPFDLKVVRRTMLSVIFGVALALVPFA